MRISFNYMYKIYKVVNNRNFFCQVAYDGISYLNEVEELTFKRYLEDNNMIRNINNMSYKEGDEIKRAIDSVANWLEFSGDPDEDPEYIVLKISVSSVNVQYLLQKILRSRFSRIWTTCNNEEVCLYNFYNNDSSRKCNLLIFINKYIFVKLFFLFFHCR